MTFSSLPEAIAHWRALDREPLYEAIVPPVNIIGDEIFDCMLAVWFRRLCEMETLTEQLAFIERARDTQRPTLRMLERTSSPSTPHIQRIERVLAVLDVWADELVNASQTVRQVA